MKPMREMEFEIEGRAVRGFVQEIQGVLWAHVDGETFSYDPRRRTSGRRRGGSASAADPGTVLAPMPGRIAKVHAREGDDVSIGTPLITLEAMKMEYALKARAAGRVRSIGCKAGEQVSLGQVLAVLDVKAGEEKDE